MKSPYPSATVIPMRDTSEGPEILLLRRNPKLSFCGGYWVFPGGRIDPKDYTMAGGDSDILCAARFAAAREAEEEAGLFIYPENLVWISCWTTPRGLPKRFKTWFFITRAGRENSVRIDGGEIHDYCWIRPEQAVKYRFSGKLELQPPTFVTITMLSQYRNVDSAIRFFSKKPPLIYDD